MTDQPNPTARAPLTPEQVEWARNRASMKDRLAKEVIDVVRICDSHELLRAELAEARAALAELRDCGSGSCVDAGSEPR